MGRVAGIAAPLCRHCRSGPGAVKRELENRLNLVQSLRRKYGATVNDVIAFGDDAEKSFASFESRDAELANSMATWKNCAGK